MVSSRSSTSIFQPLGAPGDTARRGNRRRLVVFLGALVFTAIPSLVWVFLQPQGYRATAVLQISPGALTAPVPPPVGSPQAVEAPETSRTLATEMQVLRSRPLIEAALARMPE